MDSADPEKELPVTRKFATWQEFVDSIPLEGSLGILALGAAGVLAWKRKRFEAGWQPPEPVPPKPGMKKNKKGLRKDLKKGVRKDQKENG